MAGATGGGGSNGDGNSNVGVSVQSGVRNSNIVGQDAMSVSGQLCGLRGERCDTSRGLGSRLFPFAFAFALALFPSPLLRRGRGRLLSDAVSLGGHGDEALSRRVVSR